MIGTMMINQWMASGSRLFRQAHIYELSMAQPHQNRWPQIKPALALNVTTNYTPEKKDRWFLPARATGDRRSQFLSSPSWFKMMKKPHLPQGTILWISKTRVFFLQSQISLEAVGILLGLQSVDSVDSIQNLVMWIWWCTWFHIPSGYVIK